MKMKTYDLYNNIMDLLNLLQVAVDDICINSFRSK